MKTYYKSTSTRGCRRLSYRSLVRFHQYNPSYPLFGIAVTGDQEVITSEYASQGSSLAQYLS